MRVAVEEGVPEDHRHPGIRKLEREVAPVVTRPGVEVEVPDVRPLEPLERQQSVGRVAPPHARHRDALVAGEVPTKGLCVARLLLVVELLSDRTAELVDELGRVEEVELADTFTDDTRRGRHQPEVGLDLPRGRRALHLHDDVGAGRERRPVHLADGRCGDRPLVEVEEGALDRETELLLDDAFDVGHRKRRDVVLELPQLDDHIRRDHVRPRREELAELHERRAELVEHLAEASAAVVVRLAVGGAAPVEQVAEPVPRRDAADLRHPAKAALRLAGHRWARLVRDLGRIVLEEPDPVFELCDTKGEVVDLLALCQPRPGEGPLDGLVPPSAEALRLVPPRRERVPDGSAHRVAVGAYPAREIVRELVHRLETECREAEAGEQELGDGPRPFGALCAHCPILGAASGGVSAPGRAADGRCGADAAARGSQNSRPRASLPPEPVQEPVQEPRPPREREPRSV